MSDGRKRAYEDDQEAIYFARMETLKTRKLEDLLETFTKLKEELYYLKPGDLSLTRSQHVRLGEIEKLIKELP